MLCKHEVVGSIPIGSTNQKTGIGHQASYFDGNEIILDRIGSHLIPDPRSLTFDIVKAGFAGLHDRWILIRHSRLIA